jgi:hypothetical protein
MEHGDSGNSGGDASDGNASGGDSSNSGSSGVGGGGGSGDGSGAGSASGRGRGIRRDFAPDESSSVGGSDDSNAGGTSGESGGAGDGDGETPRRKRKYTRRNGSNSSGASESDSASGGRDSSGEAGRIGEAVPREVDPKKLRGRKASKPKGLDSTLQVACDYLFKLMAMGTGIPQMELDEKEAELLGESFAECVRALPSKKMKAAEAKLQAVMPWFGLIGALAVVGYPRIQAYKLIQSERARHAARMNRNAPFPVSEVGSASDGAETGNGTSQGVAGKTRGNLFGDSQ